MHNLHVEKIHNEQEQIKYDGVYLDEIFSKNEHNEISAYITFKADEAVKHKNRLFFENYAFKNQSCIKYLYKEDFKNEENWKDFEEKLEAKFDSQGYTNTLEKSEIFL